MALDCNGEALEIGMRVKAYPEGEEPHVAKIIGFFEDNDDLELVVVRTQEVYRMQPCGVEFKEELQPVAPQPREDS